MLFRLAYLGVTNALAVLRLLPMSDRNKDAEILALRHQIAVLERHLHGERIRFTPADRALLAALLHRLPRDVLRRIRLLVRPETVLRWHRNLIGDQHATISGPHQAGRPPNDPVDPPAGAAPGPREQHVGVPQNPRRTPRPGHQGRRLDRLGDSPRGRHRPGTASAPATPGQRFCAPKPTPSSPPISSRRRR